MYNLPKREKTITVEPDGYDGVVLEFATIGPEEAFKLMEAVGLNMEDIEGSETEFNLKPSAAVPMLELAREKVVGAEGLTIGDETFDASDPDHVASLTTNMLMAGVNELLSYPFMGNEAGKDSKGPGEPSPKGSTQPGPSTTVKAAS